MRAAFATRATSGRIRVVTFVPADLQLAAGTPSARRAFLNSALSQTEPRYYYELARYRKALQQKNALLRGAIEADPSSARRLRTDPARGRHADHAGARPAVDALARERRRAHARVCAKTERLEVRYEPNVAFEAGDAGGC